MEKLAKRCESCRPMGMFRSNKDEFLLCYDGMFSLGGLKVERANSFYRVWVVRRQTWRPKPPRWYHRVGGHSGTGRLAPTLHPPFRQQIHRDPTCRDRSSRPNHLRKRHAMHLGRPRHESVSSHLGRRVRRDRFAGTQGTRGDEHGSFSAPGQEGCDDPTCVRVDSDGSVVPP